MRVSLRVLGAYESGLEKLLLDKLAASSASVLDVSGGCGASYHVKVASKRFQGLPVLKQHRLVQDVLKDEIRKWHALKIDTSVCLFLCFPLEPPLRAVPPCYFNFNMKLESITNFT